MQRITATLIGLIAALAVPAAAIAQLDSFTDAPFEISADSIDYERARDVYVARGNVRIVQQQKSLTADWVALSRTGGRGVASGRVVFSDGVENLFANFAEFGLDSLQGVLFVAQFDDAQNRFRMEGDELLKTGDRTYAFEEGMFTTCRCPEETRDPWQIRAESAELDLDGYAIARNTTVNILGVPILWLPWMAYPLRSDRETGFLFPEFGFRNRSGFMLGLPFFWAAAQNLNLTATPRYFFKRGFKIDLAAEYLLGERSSGQVFAAYNFDQAIVPNSPQDPFDEHRWVAKGRQDIFLPAGWRLQSEFAFFSDNRYPSDYRDLQRQQRDRYIGSNVFATKHIGRADHYGFVGAALVADDIQSPDEQDRDPYMLQRLPDVEFVVLPEPLPWLERLVPSMRAEYAYFAQWQNPDELFSDDALVDDDLFYDVGIDALEDEQERIFTDSRAPDPHDDDFASGGGPEGDGKFQEGEPLGDRGSRLLLNPRLAVPWRFGKYAEIYPEIGWRQSGYHTRAQGIQTWGSFTARADIRTRLRRQYGDLTHIVEPRLGYGLVTTPDLDDRPLFVPGTAVPQQRIRQLDLDNVTRDTADRVDDYNGITLGVGNRIYRLGDDDGPRLLADINVSTQYDFANGGTFGNFVIDAIATPFSATGARVNISFDPEDFELDEMLAELKWRGSALSMSLTYRYLRTIPRFFEDFRFDEDRFDDFDEGFNQVSQAFLNLGYLFTSSWSARWTIGYSFENDLLLTNRAAVEYLSKCNCWAVGVEVAQNRQFGFEFNLLYRIVGLGNDPTGITQGGLSAFGFLDGS